eukprot:s4904_g6.t1
MKPRGRIVDRIKALAGVGGGAQQKNPLAKLADKLRFKRVTLVIRKQDVSGYWHYFKNRDLGFVFRVDRDHTVHVAGVRPGSPASRMGISHSWRLLVINGKHVKADTDASFDVVVCTASADMSCSIFDVQDQLANTKLPIYCLFRAPRTEKDDEEAELDSSDAKELSASGMRLITMSLGIMQSFNGIQRIDIEWPELFTKVMEILANFTFNFNFFQPDCSVSSPYWYTWLGFTVAPYAMMLPITFSYLVVRWLSFRESRGDPQYRDVQSWLLLNAWGRAMLTILLLFIQMHMTKLSSPFQCYTLKDGSAVMVDSQDIYCDLADDQYFLIFTVACIFWVIFSAGFATLNVCLYWSYHWQAGTKTRDRIPIYVAAVEMSVENMRGWVEVVRLRVLSNIVAVRTYPSVKDQEAQERRALMEAKMKQRGVAVVPETKAGRELDKELADMRKRKATLEDEVNLREIKMKWKNKEKFTEKQAWPDRLDGSYVTYGWVLIFSTFFRQFALMLSALVSNDFPPFGAASQSLVFMINFGALILLFPYNARLLNIEESVLTGCMAFLTFMAAFKEMLSKHNQASQYTGTISATSSLIDVLVLIIVTVICGTMVFNFYIIVGGAVKSESDDQILNKAYFDTAMQSAMAADPTAIELAALTEVRLAMRWAGFDIADLGEATVPGSLLKHFGLIPANQPRVVGVFPDSDLQTMLAAWKPPDATAGATRAPTLAEMGMAKLFVRACQLVAGTGVTLEELKAQASANATQPTAATPGTSSAAHRRKIKLSTIISQVDDSEVFVAEEKEILKCYQRYETVFGTGERPAKDCEPTAEQLSGVLHLLSVGQPPYTDFSVFGPFGHRMMKRIRLSGYNIERDGSLKTVELYGPNNVGTWLQSYNVLLTILVMADAVDLGNLQRYRTHVERLAERYGQKVWSVIYQADVRCRLEQMERLKRKLAAEHEAAVTAGKTTDFDDKRPWNAVWAHAVNDETFWREEVTEPCMLILTKITSSNEILEGDAKVAGQPSSAAGPRETVPGPARMANERPVRPRNTNRTGRVHNIQDGKYTHNRTGYAICAGYNSGQCSTSTQGVWCSQQWDTVHQCDRCLGAHPSSRCPHAELQTPGFVKNAKGGRKGKSGGRGAKGKRPPY